MQTKWRTFQYLVLCRLECISKRKCNSQCDTILSSRLFFSMTFMALIMVKRIQNDKVIFQGQTKFSTLFTKKGKLMSKLSTKSIALELFFWSTVIETPDKNGQFSFSWHSLLQTVKRGFNRFNQVITLYNDSGKG